MRIYGLCRFGAWVLAIGAAASIASCGGDDGGGTPPPPSNGAPVFTSAATATIAENATGTLITPAATDPEGDAVTLAIAGGPDAAAFTLTGGTLAFVSPRDFDRPTDGDTDNVYEVTLSATDARGAAATQAVRVTVTNDREGIAVSRLASGFGADAVIAVHERTDEMVVASQNGTMRRVDVATGATSVIGRIFTAGETGRVLALAEFNDYYVAMLDMPTLGVIVRAIPTPPARYDEVVDERIAGPSDLKPRGTLFIGGDGFLFGALGDPSGDLAQDANSGYGKFYRIQVDDSCGASLRYLCLYAELFGDGVHAPAGGGGYNGQSFLLDRGTGQQEEVDFFNQDARPLDFGWPYREGTLERVANPPPAVIGPSLTYARGTGAYAGAGMTGSLFYAGPIAALAGKVLMTDESGKIFAFAATFLSDGILHRAMEMENRTADFAPLSGTIERPVSIIQNRTGRVFVLDGDGELYATT